MHITMLVLIALTFRVGRVHDLTHEPLEPTSRHRSPYRYTRVL